MEQYNESPKYTVRDADYGSEENYTYINDVLQKPPILVIINKKTSYRNNAFVVNSWRYFKVECKKKFLEEKNKSDFDS